MALGLTMALALAGGVFAQADLTGTLQGTTRLEDGAAVPGVLVTASSDALQGKRTAYSSESGQWIIRNLPPGAYEVRFELEGMATVQSNANVSLGQVTPVNVTMGVSVQEETILVTGELPSVLASSEVSTTYDFEEVNNLPITRDPDGIASLAPGLTTNTPNGGQVTISGAFAYDNIFLIDGVDANDNLFGTSNPVFIEDAISDVQVLTSGISAEYGRFTGGVVNVITKSGGNEFEGTLRADLTNADWRERTPFEEDRNVQLTDNISEAYSGTFGGYVLKDKLWFFAAGRDEESSAQSLFFTTGLPRPTSLTEERYEGKLTFNAADKHQFQATITDREQTSFNTAFAFSATPDTYRTRTDPSDLKVGRYSGVLTASLFAELQYSEKTFTFNNTHGLDADTTPGTDNFIENSPFFDFFGNFGGHYNAPYFDGKDPEDRNNEQLAGSLSWFLDTAAVGTHDLKVGAEDFSSFRTGGNSQSPTDWVMSADIEVDANGDPVILPGDRLNPVWTPGSSGAWNFIPNRDAEIELNTKSVFVNDRWQLNDNWSFNVGFRYEDVQGESQGGIVTVDTDAIVPRLAASYDVRGDGKYRFDVTYAQYAGKYSETQFADNTDVGNPPGLLYIYVGAPGQGYDFAPAYDFTNPDLYVVAAADDGTQNIVVDTGINSPVVDEITLSAGMELGNGGFLKAIYTQREYNDFVEDFITTDLPPTDVVVMGNPAGTFSTTFITNSDVPERNYKALQLIGRYRVNDKLTLNGNYTFQIENEGNFEGEGTNTPGVSSVIGDYPEIRSQFQHFPIGNLNDFGEHKLRAWANYNVKVGRAGTLNFALLANFDSGLTLSATDTIGLTGIQLGILDDLGYVDAPASQTIFFGERGTVEFDDSLAFDFSLNYQLPIYKDLNVWLKADVVNIFNDDAQLAGITNVTANFNGPLDNLGIPTTFTPDANFGNPTGNASFARPQEYLFTVGFRF
jgi:outer membrane receptor protein involved in Fe transport